MATALARISAVSVLTPASDIRRVSREIGVPAVTCTGRRMGL